jgi:Ca2+-binding RTX toxin-like protein
MATIQGVYVALFGRPADPAGLAFFNTVTGDGSDLTAIGDLASTAEYQSRFVGLTDFVIVSTIYQSLFNRAGELEGINFFVNELASGRQTINSIAINILDGAQGADLQVVNTKIAAADRYTQRLDLPAEVAAYNGSAAAEQGRAFLTPITATIPTDAQIDAAIATMVAAAGGGTPPPVPGDIFTLTAGAPADNIVGTANDDTFRAIVANSLESTDTLNGGGGNDLLTIAPGALVFGASPVISGIERIDNAAAGQFLNLSAVNGLEQLWTMPAALLVPTIYSEASIATRFGYESTLGGTVAIDYRNGDLAGANDTALLAVNNPLALATFSVAASDAPLIEAVDIASLGPGAPGGPLSSVAIDSFTGARSITVTGEGNILVSANALTLVATVDASTASGSVIINTAGSTQNMTVTGGSGPGQYVTGSGNDVIMGGAGADLMAGGAGADTYVIQTTTIEVGGADSILAGNFDTGIDKLQFGGAAGTAANYAEVAVAGSDFLVARSAAITALAGNPALDYVAVQNADGVLVFYDGDGDNNLISNGTDFAVLIQGITNAQIAATDIV